MSDYPMLISNKLHSFRNFVAQKYKKIRKSKQISSRDVKKSPRRDRQGL